jgi:PST family polysaccharide transporter
MLVAIAAAPVVAAFFHRSDVAPLTRLLSVYLLAASLGALPESLLRRDLLFRRLTGATVARVLITGVVSVGLALSGLGAWALAWGTVAGAIGYAAATWVLLPVKPDLAFWRADRREVGRVLGYGIPVAGGSLLSKLIFNVDYLIIGRMLGATALGYYTLAFRIPELVIINVFFVLSGVAFPMFSRLRGDLGRMGNAYLFSVRLYSLYGLCAGVGLAVVGSLAIPLVFGARWQAAVAPLIPLALYAACRSIGTGANDVYKAIGRPGLAVSLSLLRLAVLVPALVAGARFGGIVGVAWAQVGAALAMAVVMQARAARVLVLRISRLGRAIVPGLLGAAAVLVVGTPLSRLHLAPPVALVLAVSGAVAGVVLVLVLFQRPLLRDLLAMARRQPRAAA